jgi:hypothetical protein
MSAEMGAPPLYGSPETNPVVPAGGEKQIPSPPDHPAAPSPLEVKAVREIIVSLSRALRASRVYQSDNPAFQKILQDYVDRLCSFLQGQEEMVWELSQSQILFRGHTIYENQDPSESLVLRLYRDGIRQLRFYRGIEPGEAEEFFEILRLGLYQEAEDEEDLAALFWERDIPHLDCLAVESWGESGEGEAEADFSTLSQGILEHGRAELESLWEASPGSVSSGMTSTSTPTPSIAHLSTQLRPLSIFPLSQEEIDKVRTEMAAEAKRDLGQEFIDLLLEILSAREEIEGEREILAMLERIIDSYCQQGDFHRPYNTLRLLHRLQDSSSGLPEARRKRIGEAIERMGGSDQLGALVKVLNRADEDTLFAFRAYAYFLGPGAIVPLCEMTGELKQMKFRRLLCETIVQMAQGQVHRLEPALRDQRWYVVRNVAYILGMMKDPQGVRLLRELVRHPEFRVKKEAIRSLGSIGNAEARRVLLGCLEAADPQAQVAAAHALASLQERKALPSLLRIIQARDFLRREKEDRKAFFDALGRLGSNEQIPLLEGLLFRRNFFQRREIEEDREGAARALALIGTAEARRILQKGIKGRDKAIAQACRSALSSLPTVAGLAGEEEWM